jgi:short-subunit dehydrogenase
LTRADCLCVLVTGATGDIGNALTRAYSGPGRHLILQGRNEQRLRDLCIECKRRGATVESKVLDVRDTAALMAWITALAEKQNIDLALVNAGTINVIHARHDIEPWVEIEKIIDVNIRAAMATVSALLPHMQERGSGQIALISSLVSYFGMPVAPSYSASKSALKTYGEALRTRLARQGIKINVVMPGFVRSAMCDKLGVRKAFVLSPDEAAQRIVRGLRHNAPHISFPWPLALGAWLLSMMPEFVAKRIAVVLHYDRP